MHCIKGKQHTTESTQAVVLERVAQREYGILHCSPDEYKLLFVVLLHLCHRLSVSINFHLQLFQYKSVNISQFEC